MKYFTPGFWFGMTASPETNRFDVYEIFHHNIACEIRLQQALEEDLLCPFHYFEITDLTIGGDVIGDADNADSLRRFRHLTSDDRVDYVIGQANYYGHSGGRVKGLVFCSRKEEARELSGKFNARGFRTETLKDNIRRYVMEGDRVISGISTIHFDEVSRKWIFAAIDSANFSDNVHLFVRKNKDDKD